MTFNLQLFDDFERTDLELSGYSTPFYDYLNQSARPRYKYIRQVLESWFANFKTSDKKRTELWTEFRDEDNQKHLASFFELYLHALFVSGGFKVDIEPDWNSNDPDFLLTNSKDEQFLIEATGIYPESEFGWQKKQENKVIDYLNDNLDCPDYFLHIDVKSSVQGNIPYGQLRRFLQREINLLNYEDVVSTAITKYDMGFERFPIIKWENSIWSADIRVIPKNDRDKKTRPMGSQSFTFRLSTAVQEIKNCINRKATKYGKPKIPYIIVVNSFTWMDDIDVMDALFGKEVYIVDFDSNEANMKRQPDGVWHGPNGYNKRRVSAVCFFNRLTPSSIHLAKNKMWHYPNPYFFVDPTVFPFTQMFANTGTGKYNEMKGIDLNNILGLDVTRLDY